MAEDCPDGDYLGAYSRFFSEFVARVNPDDQLPVSVSSYNVTEAEIVGEIINVTLKYLNQTQCPSSLQAHLVHQVIQEIKSICKKQPEDCGFKSQEKTYTSFKLMKAITGKVNEICTRYLDNSRLALLPPPPSTPLPQYAAGGSKNRRRKMEDRYAVVHDLHTIFGIEDDSIANYYAVFDGHAGQDAAAYCATHLHQYLAESVYYPFDPEDALRHAFLTTDIHYLEKLRTQKVCDGTTAVCTLILNKRLYVAWVGDSTATLIKRDSVVQLVNPHRLHRKDEVERIRKAGGLVMQSMGIMRVNGVLSVSRAIGDYRFKPFVTGEPEIKTVPLDGTEDFLVLATDGLTDYLEPAEILTILYHEIQRNPNGFKHVHQLLLHWAKQAGSRDNITVVVVLLTSASEIASRPLNAIPFYHSLQVNDILEKMNSKDKPLFLDIDDAHNAINSNILKQTMISHEPRNHDDDGILTASNGKHENGDADYDYSDLGPETDVDAIDDVTTVPVKNLSYEFYKDNDCTHDEGQPDKDSDVLDNMDIDKTTNANISNVNANTNQSPDSNLHEDNDDNDDDDDDDDNDYHDDNNIHEDNNVPDEITISKTVHDEIPANIHEIVREEIGNEVRAQFEESLNTEEIQVKNDDRTDDAQNVDEVSPVDYDDSPPSPQAMKPLQHALIHETDNVADSEDSEDEWNYYRVDPNKKKDSITLVDEPQETRNEEIKEPELLVGDTELKVQFEGLKEDIKCESPKKELLELINTEISAKDKTEELEEEEDSCVEKPKDMDFQLNPNAAEFIPVSPQFMGTTMNLVEDYPVSGSPFKQVPEMDNIQVPSQSEFEKEVCQRPREVETEEKEYQNGDTLQRTDYTDFISDQQKATSTSGNLDDSEISSTKAEFGDESTASFLTTSEFHRTGNISTIEESFSSSERDYDISKDPMAMSFTPSDFKAAFDKGVDLNAVHNLSNTDLEDKNGIIDKEEDFTAESLKLEVDSYNLTAVSDVEESKDEESKDEESKDEESKDKSSFPEKPTELVNLSLQQEDSEDTLIFIENATESKVSNVDFLNLQSESSQVEQQAVSREDHSPLTENYSTEFESEKEPASVDNEQPLSHPSVDINETKPMDETSEDIPLLGNEGSVDVNETKSIGETSGSIPSMGIDLQEEASLNEGSEPPSLSSPIPDAMENELIASVESSEIQPAVPVQSSLHPDAPEFMPGQYSFQSYGTESSKVCQLPPAERDDVCQALPSETTDVCKASPTQATDTYQSLPVKISDEPVKQDLVTNAEFYEKDANEPLLQEPDTQNMLSFTETQIVSEEPCQIQSAPALLLSPQKIEKEAIDDVICAITSPVATEPKLEEEISSEEINVIVQDKAEDLSETMKELVKPVNSVEAANVVEVVNAVEPEKIADQLEAAVEPMEPVKEFTLNLSDSIQEFRGLEDQLIKPKDKVGNVQEEELKDVKQPEEPIHSVVEEECKIQKNEKVYEFLSGVRESEVKEPEVEQLEVKELQIKDSEVQELMAKESEIKEVEFKESEVMQSEVQEAEVKEEIEVKEEVEVKEEPKVKEAELKEEVEVKEEAKVKGEADVKEEEEVKRTDVMEEAEDKEVNVKEAGVKEAGVKEAEVTEAKVTETKVTEAMVTEAKVTEAMVTEAKVTKAMVTEANVTEAEVTEAKGTEAEVKDTEAEEVQVKVAEIKEAEVKESEVKEPEVKESMVKELEVAKMIEVTENKVVEVASAVAATAAVTAGVAAALIKGKTKTSTAPKSTKAATSKTATPKSTPTSPSKTTVATTRMSTAATKKPSTTTLTRPKDLDAPKKSIVSSTTTNKPLAQKSASKTSAPTTKSASKTTLGVAPKPKPVTAASPKQIVTEKKPNANGDVKFASKQAATKPPTKSLQLTKSTLVKTSTTRTSTGTAATTKQRPASATTITKSTTSAKSSNTTTTASTTTTTNARPKTAPAVGHTMKTRTSASKTPMIDKQIKETANKQISMARASNSASKTTTRVSTSSSTATTMRRVSSTTKTTTAASPIKKSATTSKVSKTSTGGKTTIEKRKVLQNGMSENVEINTIIDDVPKKDLSPVIAPNDNQLIMSTD